MNAALSACGRASKWAEAINLLFVAQATTLQPSLISFSAAISACERGSEWEFALGLFQEMQSLWITPSTISLSAAISACEKGSNWQLALHFLSLTKAADVICCSAAISACEKGTQWSKALEILHGMPLRHCTPNVISYNAAISACENGNQWEEAMHLFASLRTQALQPTARTFNALISACGHWKTAAGLFTQMLAEDVEPTVVTYNALLACLESADIKEDLDKWLHSVRLLERMECGEVEPNVLTFNTAIAVNRQRLAVVTDLLKAMEWKKLSPDVISYNSAISACQANSEWSHALQLLDEMHQGFVRGDRISCNAALSCCFAASRWEKVFELLDGMVDAKMDGFTASRYDHVCQAGSSLDCFKHTVLIGLLQQFTQDASPFTYVDTHAGRGVYDLIVEEAKGNFQNGIARLCSRVAASGVANSRCHPLQEYLALQGQVNKGTMPPHPRYLGSPCISHLFLRPQDQAICFEYAVDMHRELVKSIASMQRHHPHARTTILQENSYWWLLHHLPSDVRRGRGLVLMDPPYEPYDEYMAWNLYALRHLYHT